MLALGEDGFEAQIAENLCGVAIVNAVDDGHDSARPEFFEGVVDSILGQLILPLDLAGGA